MLDNRLAYLLTEDQVREALVRGAVEMGIIPREEAVRTIELYGDGQIGASVDFIVNGAVVTIDGGFDGAPDVPVPFAPTTIASSTPTTPVGDGPGDLPNGILESEVVELKELLAKAMRRPPGIPTIRKWSAAQCNKAKKWAKDVGKGEATEADRPDFIVPRAARGSKSKPSNPPTDAKTNEISGHRTKSNRDFFEGPEEPVES